MVLVFFWNFFFVMLYYIGGVILTYAYKEEVMKYKYGLSFFWNFLYVILPR
jgi:hypothetical protein